MPWGERAFDNLEKRVSKNESMLDDLERRLDALETVTRLPVLPKNGTSRFINALVTLLPGIGLAVTPVLVVVLGTH